MAYIFATELHTNEPFTTYIAIPESDVITQPIADCRDESGQQIGAEDAGDCITLISPKAIRTANALLAGWESEGNNLEGFEAEYEIEEVFTDIFNVWEAFKYGSNQWELALELLAEGEDYELHQEEVRCVDFHDGHNWKTYIFTGQVDSYGDLEEVEDDLAAELASALEEKEYETEQPGITIYRSGKWRISRSAWQGSFGAYEIVLEEEFESVFA